MTEIIKSKNIQEYCRVCFQSSPIIISCLTSITISKFSCSISEIFNLLSPTLKNEFSHLYPKGICPVCKDLVETVIHLKLKLEQSSNLLLKLFQIYGEESIQIKNVNETDSATDIEYSEQIDEKMETVLLVYENGDNETYTEESHINSDNNSPSVSEIKMKEVQCGNEKIIKHVCPSCIDVLPSAQDLKEHISKHKALKKYLVGKPIGNRSKFIASARNTISIFKKLDKMHHCNFCNKELPTESFQAHILFHYNQKEYSCNQCKRVFRKLNHYRSHINTHLKRLPFQCDFCDKGFVLRQNYDYHVLTHREPNNLPYKCEYCEKGFVKQKLLYFHRFKHTDGVSYWTRYKVHRCKLCLRTFPNDEELHKHSKEKHDWIIKRGTRSHQKTKSLCSTCGATVGNLKQHQRSHQKRNPIECNICHKMLSSKITLQRHLRIHKDERPYQCSFCGKAFRDQHTMQVHERIHIGIKKHICPVCKKGFLEKAYMLKHLRNVHNKE